MPANQLEDGSLAESSQDTMASTFKGRNTAKTADELKKARESRAADALKMKGKYLLLTTILILS